jgi:hypothetical protein
MISFGKCTSVQNCVRFFGLIQWCYTAWNTH